MTQASALRGRPFCGTIVPLNLPASGSGSLLATRPQDVQTVTDNNSSTKIAVRRLIFGPSFFSSPNVYRFLPPCQPGAGP